jgi:pimeloyl-ACP methyl ester carboxylesterase
MRGSQFLVMAGLCVSACQPTQTSGLRNIETTDGGSRGIDDFDKASNHEDPDVYTPTSAIVGNTRVSFTLPRGSFEPFLNTPWPSELMRRQDGTIDFSHYPGRDNPIANIYVEEAENTVRGFSLSQSAYFRFEGGFPAYGRLPEYPGDTMHKESPIFLMDVDPKSPERGRFVPLDVRYYPTALTYIPEKTVAAKPMLGFVLRPGTLYAYVLRRDLNDDKNQPLGTTTELEMVKWTSERISPFEEAARKVHKDTFDYLSKTVLVKRDEIGGIALFRTGAPHELSVKLFEAGTTLTGTSAPNMVDATWEDNGYADFFVFRGHYCTPNFQSYVEEAPFTRGRGGKLVLTAQGVPVLQGVSSDYRSDGNEQDRDNECTPLMKARFVVSIPKGTAPANGWPLMITAHGTGGDATGFLGNNNFAGWAAKQGYAVVSTDQPLHGANNDPGRRPGVGKTVIFDIEGVPVSVPLGGSFTAQDMFYNPINPGAARDNVRQAMVDQAILLRLVGATDFASAKRPSSNTPLLAAYAGRTNPRFDLSRVQAIGHSQGSQVLASLAAIDPLIKGVVLSGCGGDFRYGTLRRTEPFDMKPLLNGLLSMGPMELDEMHPLMALAQMIADSVDPQTFAPFYSAPLSGRAKQNVLHFIGVNDSYAPRESAEGLAVAMRATQLEPTFGLIEGLTMLGLPTVRGPLKANNGTGATLSFIELNNVTSGANGHFVIYDMPGASALAQQFIGSVKATGVAEVGPFQP